MDKKDVSKVTTLNNFHLTFEKNIGQKDKEVKFSGRGQGYTVFFTEKEVVLTLMKIKNEENKLLDQNFKLEQHKIEKTINKIEYEISVLRMSLEGTNKNIEIIGETEQEEKVNYFKGNNPEQWVTNVPIYEKVRYKEVYPGIDVVFYGNPKQLEHDFIVKPGANPDNIKFIFEGAESIDIDGEGNLFIKVKTGQLNFQKPKVFQEIKGVREEIKAAYNLGENDKIGFKLQEYDRSKELNIDPILGYSTYLGGHGYDEGHSITIDKKGYAYVTGVTNSVDFPKMGDYDINLNGGTDVFITKINQDGSGLVYSTYLGGNNNDSGNGITIDDLGNAYLTGYTESYDFPTTFGSYSRELNGLQDVFITKINSDGSRLIYSTYLGGGSYEVGNGIVVDGLGNVYVTGYTYSSDFPTTFGAYNTSLNGYEDVFITKLNDTGSGLVYSTYLGGSREDYGQDIEIDNLGNAYVTGYTYSNNFPTTDGAYDPSLNGWVDLFVTKVNATGSALFYSTYLGGTDFNAGFGIAVDGMGNAYVAGFTGSSDFPTTHGAYQTSIKGHVDGIITKINSVGSNLVYSTYLGGSSESMVYGIDVDTLGNAYVTGYTSASDFPTTPEAYQTTIGGDRDVFVTKINSKGVALIYSTYLGGRSYDLGYGIAVDEWGNIYVTGSTYSSNFPTTSGAYDTIYNENEDVFVTKFGSLSNLSMEKIAVPDHVLIGGELSYIIRVTNNGPDAAFGVVMTDTLPASVQFVLALFSKGTINYSAGVVTWNVGILDVGEVATITIRVKPSVLGTITNTATVTFSGIDPDLSNNTVIINSYVIDIYQQISDINTTVNDIEDKIDGTTPSLITDINDEVINIEGKLDGTEPSLITEMKDQLDEIEVKIDSIIISPCPTGIKLTTGPVVKDRSAVTLVISINNSTATTVTVTITVVNYSVTPGVNNTFTVTVPANSIKTTSLLNPPSQYEVIFDGMIPGVYGWTSTKGISCQDSYFCWFYGPFINTNDFIASNTFRHAELVNKVD